MSNKVINQNIMKEISNWLEANKYITDNTDIDTESWTQLQKTILKQLEKRNYDKDPNAPKRGKSGYIFFCSANRSDVKEELGEDAKTTEITSRLGELWTELKNDESRAEELASYLKMATDDKDRYVSEKADYTSNDSSEESDSKVVKKPVAKKPVAKKPDAKKPEAKKPATKKTVTKKPATKKPDEEEDLEEDDEDEDE